MNNDTLCKPLVTSAQCIIGTEKYPDNGILLNYNDDDYSQGYGQIKEAFKALTKDNFLQTFISEHDFRSSNDDNDNGYNIYASIYVIKNMLKVLSQLNLNLNLTE